jgi:hypothetical protein
MGSPLRPDLSRLEAALGAPPLTRFAPSPTGYLHLGHVVNAIYVWGVARALGGRVVLRIEDHDRIRCRSRYEAALLDDLAWLGFEPDSGRLPILRQSDTPLAYTQALETLCASTEVYACGCSRKDIGGERYDGRCRGRSLQPGPGRGIRVRFAPGTTMLCLAGWPTCQPNSAATFWRETAMVTGRISSL